MLSPESAVALNIGNFPLKFYSITMFLAILSGSILSCFIAKKYYKEINIEKFLDMLPIVVISAILGARLYYVILDWGYYSNNLTEIFAIWNGGLSIHGGIIGGFLSGYLYIKKHSLNLWKYADIFTYGLVLGQIIGRLGNFFNIEAFGKPCSFSEILCLYVPLEKRPVGYTHFEFFHPTFLYEMTWNTFVLLVLFFGIRKFTKNIDGLIFFSYLILYSLGRFFIEGLRLDSILTFGNFHIAQLVCVLIILLSVFMISILKLKD